jgi:hypothetical protein
MQVVGYRKPAVEQNFRITIRGIDTNTRVGIPSCEFPNVNVEACEYLTRTLWLFRQEINLIAAFDEVPAQIKVRRDMSETLT